MNIARKHKLSCTFLGVILLNFVPGYQSKPPPESCNVPNGPRGVSTDVMIQSQPLQDIKKTYDSTTSEVELSRLRTDIVVNCPPEKDCQNLEQTPPSLLHTINSTGNLDKNTTINSIYSLTTENLENQYSTKIESNEIPQVIKCGTHSPNHKIIGGNFVDIDEYPWLALLNYEDNSTMCGGSLITDRFVITAAHCLDTGSGKPIKVRLAEYNISSYPSDTVLGLNGCIETINVTIVAVEWTKTHFSYNSTSYDGDIGLVKMSENVQFSDFIRPICLPEVNFVNEFSTSTMLITAGWGQDEDYAESEIKKDVALPYKELSECKERDPENKNKEMHICAGGEKGKNSCSGDSGGPLMYINGTTYVLVGIVASGHIFCDSAKPSVYTNVYGYLDWIKENIYEHFTTYDSSTTYDTTTNSVNSLKG